MEKIVRIQYLVLETAYFSNIEFSESWLVDLFREEWPESGVNVLFQKIRS